MANDARTHARTHTVISNRLARDVHGPKRGERSPWRMFSTHTSQYPDRPVFRVRELIWTPHRDIQKSTNKLFSLEKGALRFTKLVETTIFV